LPGRSILTRTSCGLRALLLPPPLPRLRLRLRPGRLSAAGDGPRPLLLPRSSRQLLRLRLRLGLCLRLLMRSWLRLRLRLLPRLSSRQLASLVGAFRSLALTTVRG
jgi:hypothetical protein